jgi:hypothetical protein
MDALLAIVLVVLVLAASIRGGVDSRPGPHGPQQRWWPGTPI